MTAVDEVDWKVYEKPDKKEGWEKNSRQKKQR